MNFVTLIMNQYSVTAKYCVFKKYKECIHVHVYLYAEKFIETSQFNRDSPNSVANMNTIRFLTKYDNKTQLM